jgi:hypothetical protein
MLSVWRKVSSEIAMKAWKWAHMCRDIHFLSISYANDTRIFSGVISRIHRYIVPIMGYCWTG